MAALVVGISLVVGGVAMGQVRVSLPLQRHYRAGKYMPVRVTAVADEATTVTVGGTDVLPTFLPVAAGRTEVIAPLLPLRAPVFKLTSTAGAGAPRPVAAPLNALRDDQRLVGFTTIDMELARSLFPGLAVIPVQLDPADPLPGPDAAWETLDAVVVDGPELLGESRRQSILANGTTLAIRSAERPDERWPWEQAGAYWVLRPGLLGPGGLIDEEVYRPTYSWAGAWPGGFRVRVVGSAVLFALVALLLSLWRRGWLAMVALAVVAVGLIGWWRLERSPLLQAAGSIQVRAPGMVQTDRWFYQTSADAVEAGFAFDGVTHPYFASLGQAQGVGMRLLCRADGRPVAFSYRLPARQRLAFCVRAVTAGGASAAVEPTVDSPMRALAQRAYLGPGVEVMGQAESGEDWGRVVLGRE